jgi:nitrogen fixation/metabolism regulation signal transduction histidine kinase
MNLKKRLGIAFVIIVILPIAMVMISLDFLSAYLGDSFKRNYEYEGGTLEIIANPMNVVNRMTHREADQIVQYADERPEDLENERILSGINDKLIPMDSFLVVREDGEFIYVGKEGMEKSLEDILPAYGSNISIENGVYYGGSDPLLIKQHDYISDDNKEGSVFIVSKVSVILPQLKSTMRLLIIIGVAILLITAILLILWLYDGITVPVKRLKKAMNELKEGNLNYKIESSSKDEIGELCDDFDAMRIQLKDLVNEQISREKRTREMLSNVSHDLKTPLTAIKGYAEGLLDGIAVNPKMQEKYMRTIWNKANDMQ